MEGDAKAVRLVTDALQHLQGLRIAVDKQRIRVSHPYYFFQAFGKAHDGDAIQDAQFGQGLPGKLKLPLATVDDNELG